MLSNIQNQIMAVFYKFGYKMGSVIGMVGSTMLGDGLLSGLGKKMADGINDFIDGPTFAELIQVNVDTILADFVSEGQSVAGDIVADTTLDQATTDSWESEADSEMAALLDAIADSGTDSGTTAP